MAIDDLGTRRRVSRKRRARTAHAPGVGLLLALHEHAPAAEARPAHRLATLCQGAPVWFLHDRRIPGRRTTIDHLAIAPSGVYVIDATEHVDDEPTRGRLRIARRGRLEQLVARVASDLAATTPVHGARCFPDAELARLTRRLRADGPLPASELSALVARLAAAFPTA